MTERVFHAITRQAQSAPQTLALQSASQSVDYGALAAFLVASGPALAAAPQVVGITAADPLQAALADLALTYHGRVCVHLPPFFSVAQKSHIIAAAGIEAVIGATFANTRLICLPDPGTLARLPGPLPAPTAGAQRIIFTSGSSGQPKGVCLGERQMAAAIAGLETAIGPQASDVHLSLLPMAQLLEQIAGLYLPLLSGARVWFCPEALPALFGGPITPVLRALAEVQPTTTILVPALLAHLLAGLKAVDQRAPASLRLVAVGGAHTAPALLAEAEAAGLPIHEGYGLSECSSVVALNRPGDTKPGTVGRVIDGVTVHIENGEIVVSGPTVMTGYLGHAPVIGEWHTGDLGRIEDGRLIVEGRKDWLIVTPAGRNINPEWVEACLAADPRVPASGLHLAPDGQLEIIAALAAPLGHEELAALLAGLPAYARPARVICVPASHAGLLKPGGGIDRSQLAKLSGTVPAHPLRYTMKECTA